MSETKPWWEGRRNRDMKGLRVHVVFKSGTEATGVLDAGGDLPQTRCHDIVVSDTLKPDDLFAPAGSVESIEPLDDVSDYFRIEDITEMRAGDVFVSTSGARYAVLGAVDTIYPEDAPCLVEIEPGLRTCIDNSLFAYGLRNPQGASHAGLWQDGSGDLAVVDESGGGQYVRIDGQWTAGSRLISPPELSSLGPWAEWGPAEAGL